MSNQAAPPSPRPNLRRDVWCALAVILLGVVLRAPRMTQSLWMDEMTTLADYVLQPWSKVLAGRAGEYVANNHVLHTAIAKVVYTALTGGRAAAEAGRAPVEAALRLPALIAGALLPVALAWPLRRRSPVAAGLVALLATVNPWLVDLGAEARGYTLMLLLGIAATALLPTVGSSRRRLIGYAVAVAAAVYTIPLAVLLVPGHAVAVWVTRRDAWRRWLTGALVAGLVTICLYLPMARGLIAYYRHPYPAATYRRFLDGLPRHVLTGQRTPRLPVDLALPAVLDRPVDPHGASVYWALPVLAVIFGTALGWPRYPDARPLLATLATATAVGVTLPLVLRGASEVRFVLWADPWFCLATGLLIAAIADVRTAGGNAVAGRSLAVATGVLLVGLMVWWDVRMPVNQPVREAVALADRLAPPGVPIVIAYVGDLETTLLYGNQAATHDVLPAFDAAALDRIGGGAWVVMLFEQMARDRAASDPAAAGVWRELTTRYRLVARLDGRVSPVAVYAPRRPPATTPAVAVAGGVHD
jgi:hypothetical protein